MLEQEPAWVYNIPAHRRITYGSQVLLTPEFTLGDWFCLERATGRIVWERTPRQMGRANSIIGVAGGIIVGHETRSSDGPYVSRYGVYRVSLTTGEFIATAHAAGRWGKFLRFLDFIPDFANDIRDTALAVEGESIICESGRVLDAETGEEVGHRIITDAFRKSLDKPETRLGIDRILDCGARGTLRRGFPGDGIEPNGMIRLEPCRYYLRDSQGELVWTFNVATQQDARFSEEYAEDFSFPLKVRPPFIYILARNGATYRKTAINRRVEYTDLDKFYFLWTLDIRNGEIAQRIAINEEVARYGQLEDIDDNGILALISNPGKSGQLYYFASRS